MNLGHRAVRMMAATGLAAAVGIAAWATEPPAKTTPPPAKTATSKTKPKPAPASPAGAKKEEAGGPGLLEGLWNKVREMMIPDEAPDGSGVRYSAVAGVRGAKSEDTTLQPIWKGQAPERAVPPDAQLYEQAKAHFTKAEYAEAVADLQQFEKLYPQSAARPQVELLLALAYAKTDHPAEAVKTLDEFLAANPGHPLAEEVKQLKAKLAGSVPK